MPARLRLAVAHALAAVTAPSCPDPIASASLWRGSLLSIFPSSFSLFPLPLEGGTVSLVREDFAARQHVVGTANRPRETRAGRSESHEAQVLQHPCAADVPWVWEDEAPTLMQLAELIALLSQQLAHECPPCLRVLFAGPLGLALRNCRPAAIAPLRAAGGFIAMRAVARIVNSVNAPARLFLATLLHFPRVLSRAMITVRPNSSVESCTLTYGPTRGRGASASLVKWERKREST
jgi:hypothetical protein